MTLLRSRIVGLAALALALGVVTAAPMSPATAVSSTRAPVVSIHVEMDLPHATNPASSGPKVLDASGIEAGPGVELTGANQTSNPSGWNGNVNVDIDPDARTITVTGVSNGNNYETVKVVVTCADISSARLVSDSLFASPSSFTPTVTAGAGRFEVDWAANDHHEHQLSNGGSAVFSYSTAFRTVATPSLAGRAEVKKTLTLLNATPAVTSPAADYVKVQWYRIVKKKHHRATLKRIPGATHTTYRVKRADEGHRLAAVVTPIGDGNPIATYKVMSRRVRN